MHVDTFGYRLIEFPLGNWHLLPRATIVDVNFFSAQAKRGARGIESYIASTDNCYTMPYFDSLTQFDIMQESQPIMEACESFTLPGYANDLTFLSTGRDKDSV